MMIRAMRSHSLVSQATRFQSARQERPAEAHRPSEDLPLHVLQTAFAIGDGLLRQLTGEKGDVAVHKAFAAMPDKDRHEMYDFLDKEVPRRVKQALSPDGNAIRPSSLVQ